MKRCRYVLIAGAAILILAAAAGLALHRSRLARLERIEQLIADYTANPTESGAGALAGMIAVGEVPEDLGGRILSALLTPIVHTRSSHAAATEPIVVLELPQTIPIHPATARLVMRLEHPDRPAPNFNGEINIDPACCIQGRFTLRGFPCEKGVHGVLATIQCNLQAGEVYHTWSWPGQANFPRWLLPQRIQNTRPNDKLHYTCTIDIPVELNIVEPGKEEKVRLVSDPNLDVKMKASVTAVPDPRSCSNGAQVKLEGRFFDTRCTGAVELAYRNPPENYAFSVSFIDSATGALHTPQYPSEEPGFVILKGQTGSITIHPPRSATLAPGKYAGTIALKPRIETADQYPEVKQIWDGTLEFPISFEIEAIR